MKEGTSSEELGKDVQTVGHHSSERGETSNARYNIHKVNVLILGGTLSELLSRINLIPLHVFFDFHVVSLHTTAEYSRETTKEVFSTQFL